MADPDAFFVVHHGERTDLSGQLKPITWQGSESQGLAFTAEIPVRRNGD